MSSKARSAWTTFAAGMLVGGGAGWGLAVLTMPQASLTAAAAPRLERSAAQPTAGAPRRRAEASPSPEPPAPPALGAADRHETLSSGNADALRRMAFRGGPLSDEEAAVVAGRLAAVQAAGDRELYVRLLESLARSPTKAARDKLVDLVGDTSVPLATLKTNLFGDLDEWTKDAGVIPGFADAARKRYEAEPKAASWTVGNGLLQIIGRHGDAEDVAWLESKAVGGRSNPHATKALALSSDPSVDAAIERLWVAKRLNSDSLEEYAARRPEAAIALSTGLLKQAEAGTEVPDVRGLFDLLGRAAVASKNVTPVRELLPSLRTAALRAESVTTIQRLHDAQFDVSEFSTFLDEPVRLLESGEWETHKIGIRYVVEYHRLLWTPRVADALDAAAGRTQSAHAAAGFRHVAKLIRDELADPWRGK